ncbi:hypothetical protein BC936DRAFT_143942 [Jimgerdemannia flammicorona]|nr:hypothetical protein BC936DRAFT_143942 [Jimgerdemannia flammicorona]
MIRYTLTCVHDKAHTLGGSSKCEYNVPIIERIDVSDSRFHVPREEIREIPFEALMMGDAHGHGHGNDGFVPKAIVRVNLPKFGYVRGEFAGGAWWGVSIATWSR